jgi:hypothetical protein
MYPVDLHMHTVASTHAYSTLHDYIAKQSVRDQTFRHHRPWSGYGRCSALLAFRQYAHLAAAGGRRWHPARY